MPGLLASALTHAGAALASLPLGAASAAAMARGRDKRTGAQQSRRRGSGAAERMHTPTEAAQERGGRGASEERRREERCLLACRVSYDEPTAGGRATPAVKQRCRLHAAPLLVPPPALYGRPFL